MSLTYRGTLVADSKEPEKCELAVNTVAVIDDDDQENNLDQPAAQSFVDRFWIYEFLAWLACLAGLLGVIAVLRATQDKPVPNWTIKHSLHGYSASFNVTINSVISLLSTAVKSTLLIPVVASLSQLKWLWFQAGNKLSDFQQFDSAAKGPLGALALIFSMRGRRLACLGAIIVIANLALDFSFQQLVTYPVLPIQNGIAFMPRADAFNLTNPLAEFGLTQQVSHRASMVDSEVVAAVYNGIFSAGSHGEFLVTPDCQTGNCTWSNQYLSIGVCAECYDISQEVDLTCDQSQWPYVGTNNGIEQNYTTSDCTYLLPNGLNVTNPGGSSLPGNQTTMYVLTTYQGTRNSTHFADDEYYIATFALLNTTFVEEMVNDAIGTKILMRPSRASAAECGLSYCVKRFEGNVTLGTTYETIIDTYKNTSVVPGNFDDPLAPPESFFPSGYNDSRTFQIDYESSDEFSTLFIYEKLLDSVASIDGTGVVADSNIARRILPMNFTQISDMFENIATSLTNMMRTTTHSAEPLVPSPGVANTWVPKVRVRWGWIAIPAALVALAIIFLVATAIESRRHNAMLWKGSTLPPFYHPLTRDGRSKVAPATVSTPKHLQDIAKEMHVRWHMTENGYRLVQTES